MTFRTFRLATVVAAQLVTGTGAVMAQSELNVSFADSAWTGERIPEGQHCALQGGNGSTPALTIGGVPEGTTEILVAFNDETYTPMADGGHGVLAFAVKPDNGAVAVPSVPGGTLDLPAGVRIAQENRTAGDYLTAGYVPPCSGGVGNTYSADVSAVDAAGTVLATGYILLGTY